jgi:hypothetical protein
MVVRAALLIALASAAGACHLALGLETAEETAPVSATAGAGGTPGGAGMGGTGGIEPECDDASTCADQNPCTEDRCDDGRCVREPLDAPAAEDLQTAGDCRLAVCQMGALTEINDDADTPPDQGECSTEACTLGTPSNPAVGGGTTCSEGGGAVCNGEGACTECFTNAQCTSPETCGGGGDAWECGCTPVTCAAVGVTCGITQNGCGAPLNCNNASMDGMETDIDCGGPIATCNTRCLANKMCDVDSDCSSGDCHTTPGACFGN